MVILYDPRYQTFQSWASLLVEQFASNQLEIPNDSTDWKLWGDGLKAIDIFANEAVPSTSSFENWEDWASALLLAVNSGA